MLATRLALFAGLAVVVAGCSSKSPYTASVSGKITYKGQPVKAGMVYLAYESGQYESPLKDDGTYEFRDLPVGAAKIAVDNQAFDPDQKSPVYGAAQKSTAKGYASGYDQYNKTVGGGAMATKGENEAPTTGPSKKKKDELALVYVKIPKQYYSVKTTTLSLTVEKGSQTKDFDLTD